MLTPDILLDIVPAIQLFTDITNIEKIDTTEIGKFDKTKIQFLEEWLSVPEAAEVFETTKSRVHQMIDEGKFHYDDLRRVGIGPQPMIIIHKRCLNVVNSERRPYIRNGEHKKT